MGSGFVGPPPPGAPWSLVAGFLDQEAGGGVQAGWLLNFAFWGFFTGWPRAPLGPPGPRPLRAKGPPGQGRAPGQGPRPRGPGPRAKGRPGQAPGPRTPRQGAPGPSGPRAPRAKGPQGPEPRAPQAKGPPGARAKGGYPGKGPNPGQGFSGQGQGPRAKGPRAKGQPCGPRAARAPRVKGPLAGSLSRPGIARARPTQAKPPKGFKSFKRPTKRRGTIRFVRAHNEKCDF